MSSATHRKGDAGIGATESAGTQPKVVPPVMHETATQSFPPEGGACKMAISCVAFRSCIAASTPYSAR